MARNYRNTTRHGERQERQYQGNVDDALDEADGKAKRREIVFVRVCGVLM